MADELYRMSALHASSATEGVPGSLDMVAAFDAMAAESRARRAGGVGSSTEDTTAKPQSGDGPPVSPRKRPRRNKAQMVAARAAKARAIQESYREQVPEGHWIEEPDEAMDRLMEGLRREDT